MLPSMKFQNGARIQDGRQNVFLGLFKFGNKSLRVKKLDVNIIKKLEQLS
jgi:hypothetical protein